MLDFYGILDFLNEKCDQDIEKFSKKIEMNRNEISLKKRKMKFLDASYIGFLIILGVTISSLLCFPAVESFKSFLSFVATNNVMDVAAIYLSLGLGIVGIVGTGFSVYGINNFLKKKFDNYKEKKNNQIDKLEVKSNELFKSINDIRDYRKMMISDVRGYYDFLIPSNLKNQTFSPQEVEKVYELMFQHGVALPLYLLYRNKLDWFANKTIDERMKIDKEINLSERIVFELRKKQDNTNSKDNRIRRVERFQMNHIKLNEYDNDFYESTDNLKGRSHK